MTDKPSTLGNPTFNAILDRTHQVLWNLVCNFNITQTYVDEDVPWSFMLSTASFVIRSTTNRKKVNSPGQLLFGRDMILLINYKVDWELIRQKKYTQIDKDNIRKNINRVDHDYKVRDKVMLTNNTAYKYETTYNGAFVITQFWNNGTVKSQYGAT